MIAEAAGRVQPERASARYLQIRPLAVAAVLGEIEMEMVVVERIRVGSEHRR